MNIELHPKKLFYYLLCFILFLLCLNVYGIISTFYFNDGHFYGLIPAFDFNTERNIPTLYSFLALVLASLLLFLIAKTNKIKGKTYLPWIVLAFLFIFLAVDEIGCIHEELIRPMRKSFNASGYFHYPWVIPYGIGLMVFLASYLKFLNSLPKRIMYLFILSGSVFVSGALGFEMLGGKHAEVYGKKNLLYSYFYTCEEFLEMLGIAIFIYTLLTYMVSQIDSAKIAINKNSKLFIACSDQTLHMELSNASRFRNQ